MQDFNVFAARLPVGEDWSVVEIPFASLRQIGFGKSLPWAADDLKGLDISARQARAGQQGLGSFELQVDWIRLY